MEKIEELNNITKLNVNNCPWTKKKDSLYMINELINELNELKKAIENKDKMNIIEELGDCYWDLFNLTHILQKEQNIDIEESLESIINKIKRRKPWLFEGKKISEQEAIEIWQKAKQKEKINKEKNNK